MYFFSGRETNQRSEEEDTVRLTASADGSPSSSRAAERHEREVQALLLLRRKAFLISIVCVVLVLAGSWTYARTGNDLSSPPSERSDEEPTDSLPAGVVGENSASGAGAEHAAAGGSTAPFELNLDNWIPRAPELDDPFFKKHIKHKDLTAASFPCSRSEPGPANEDYPQVLPKRAFSDRIRFVFVLGTEGAGHHFTSPMMARCAKAGGPCKCASPEMLNIQHHSGEHGMFGAFMPHSEVKTEAKKFVEAVRAVIIDAEAAQRSGTYGGRATYFLNSMHGCHNHGQLSYPNFSGECQPWKIADVRMLAEIFESLGADFRVLVVLRNAIDVLVSTTVHRKYGKWTEKAPLYGRIVKHDMLEKQLQRIDRSFFQCMSYDSLPSIPAGVGEFLGVNPPDGDAGWTIEAEAAAMYKVHNETVHDHEVEAALARFGKTAHLSFEESLRELAELCGLPPPAHRRV